MKSYIFEDEYHEHVETYYDCLELWEELDSDRLEAYSPILHQLHQLTTLIPKYVDPLNLSATIHYWCDDTAFADRLVEQAYHRAVNRIVLGDGRWPDEMIWGWAENRHLLRALEAYSLLQWRKGELQQAISVLQQILKMNPNDNQGARFYLLAILLGYTWDSPMLDDLDRRFPTLAQQFPRYFLNWLALDGSVTE